jgi:hypothetical protein
MASPPILTRRTLGRTYQAESENVKPRHACSLPQFNQQESCEAEGGVWAASAAKGLPPPVCQQVAWGRDNHLGNGLDGHAHSFNWTLPSPPHNATQATCVLRLRYNIRCAQKPARPPESTRETVTDISKDYTQAPYACSSSSARHQSKASRQPTKAAAGEEALPY